MLSSNTKKYLNGTLLIYGIFAVVGFTVLILGTFFNILRSEMPGICAGFIPTGVMGIILTLRMKSKPEKAEKLVRLKTEERRQFIRDKAGNLSFHILLYSLSVATILSRYISISLTFFLAITVISAAVFYLFSSIMYSKIN